MDARLIAFQRLLDIMDQLREQCPWDKKQTMESLRYLTLEEVYELSDAIVENDFDEIKKELGDVMLHLVFYSKIASESGLNPAVNGDLIRVPMPPLTEERRKDLIKVVKSEGENAKISIRNIRRDGNDELKKQLKEKLISEDDEKRDQAKIQTLTDEFIKSIDSLIASKEKDLLEI